MQGCKSDKIKSLILGRVIQDKTTYIILFILLLANYGSSDFFEVLTNC
jgi:hypothetical protein